MGLDQVFYTSLEKSKRDKKETKNELPPFHLMLPAIDLPAYKLAKFLLSFLLPLTQNKYTIISSFHFAEEIWKQDHNSHMSSLDVDSLFTNMNKTIVICVDSLCKDDENTLKIPKIFFVICSTWPPKNLFLCLTTYSINKLMVWLWGLH